MRLPLLLTVFLLTCACAAFAGEKRARIFIGLPAGETQAARLVEIADSIQESLCRRGADPAATTIHAHDPARPLRRDAVLAALAPPPGAAADDETWIVLLGTSAPARDGQPAFQIAGPRLTAADLAAALGALPGKKFVVVGTGSSGGFLPPLLALPDVEAVAATADAGEIGEPRFAAFWAEVLAARPEAGFAELAAAAADRVNDHYAARSLAQGEHARLIDRAGGRIIEAPFPAAVPAPAERPPADAPASQPPAVDIAALNFPRAAGGGEVERRPADDASRALLAAARAASAGFGEYAAVFLRTEVDLLVAQDFSSCETWRTRAYLRTGEALDELGTLRLPSEPPFVAATLVSARVIRPDGDQLLLNPAARFARLAVETRAGRDRGEPGSSVGFIQLPDVTAGCVVEAEWTVERRPDGSLPEFYQEWSFARCYPQRSLRVRLTLPAAERWRAFAPGLPAPNAAAAGPSTRTQSWELSDLAAHDPLPGDPPARTFTPWLGVSSVASWADFAAWYRRLAAGSEVTGSGVEALAAGIAAAHPDRAGRLRAAYEAVSALRYVAIELGVGAVRPRTPEQVWNQHFGDCKDKANLLVAVLAKLGIPAEFALVNRFDATFADFPGWQFNHALVRVPAAPDAGQPADLWLDTTDRLVPFGIVAPGDLGRQALVFASGFASAALREITAAQEAPSEWRENFAHDAATGEWRVQISAAGSAEVTLRHLLLNLGPAARREHLRALLGWPEAAIPVLEAPDPYDLSAPCVLAFTVRAPADALDRRPPPPLAPGLAAHLAPSGRPRLWDEGRTWRYTRTGPQVEESRVIPARLPAARSEK